MSTSDETSVSSDQELEADLSSSRKDVLNTSFKIDDVLKVAWIDVINNDDVPKKSFRERQINDKMDAEV